MSGILDDRGKALEKGFFAKQDEQLLDRIRERQLRGERRELLREVSGLTDETLLERLEALGIEAETLAALAMFPLVAVAWADGVMEPSEREAVLQGAEQAGLSSEGDAARLLRDWLEAPPPSELLAAWHNYAKAICAELDAAERAQLRDQLIGRAHAVADAAGGFLGLGNRVSKEEAALLDELKGAFD